MTKPTTYQSQISRTSAGQIQIMANQKRILISKSDLYWLLRVFVTLGLVLLFLYEIISIVTFIVVFIVLLILYTVLVIFSPTVNISELERILIDEQRIMYIYKKEKDNESVFIGDDDYLDLKIRIAENGTKVSILNETIQLRNVEDLPNLMDGISEVMNLEFYDTCQLSDKTEVITYKSKAVTQVDYLTNIKIEQKNDTTYFTDTFDRLNKFSIVESNQKLEIHYLHRFENGNTFNKSIDLNDIGKVVLRLEQLSKGYYYFIVEVYIAKAKHQDRIRIVFKSSSDLGELETRRSMDNVYGVLKNVKSLQYVIIEKKG